ncbi:MAG: hypothetical protein ACI9XP_001808 [Lentimonas sp.]|jgi:hypothetical protein
MMNKLCFSLLILFTSSGVVLSQECDKVYLKGKVTDTLRPQSFYNLVVVNITTGKGVFGMPDGAYDVYASINDSIILSIKGYQNISFKVNPDQNCQDNHQWYIEAKPQQIAEMIVRPIKSLNDIQEERETLALRETRTVQGLQAFQSPITALYEAFSKREKNKRWIAQKEYEDKQKALLQELLRTYVAFDIFDLTEQEFDDFIAFLNLDPDFLKTASEMELVTFIQDKFEHFKYYKKN